MTDIVNPIDPPVVPPVPQRNDEATFEDRSDAGWEFAFETLPGYMQDTMDNVHQNAVAAKERAQTADERAADAEDAKDAAETARDKAQDWAEGVEPEPGSKSAKGHAADSQVWAAQSEAYRDSAAAMAAAAGAAAGLPALVGNAKKALFVKGDESGVEFHDLPEQHQVGDILATARPLSAPQWLRCDGAIYGQADYPELFQALNPNGIEISPPAKYIGSGQAVPATPVGSNRSSACTPSGGHFVLPSVDAPFIELYKRENLVITKLASPADTVAVYGSLGLSFSHDGKYLACNATGAVRIYKLQGDTLEHHVTLAQPSQPQYVRFSKDDPYLLVGLTSSPFYGVYDYTEDGTFETLQLPTTLPGSSAPGDISGGLIVIASPSLTVDGYVAKVVDGAVQYIGPAPRMPQYTFSRSVCVSSGAKLVAIVEYNSVDSNSRIRVLKINPDGSLTQGHSYSSTGSDSIRGFSITHDSRYLCYVGTPNGYHLRVTPLDLDGNAKGATITSSFPETRADMMLAQNSDPLGQWIILPMTNGPDYFRLYRDSYPFDPCSQFQAPAIKDPNNNDLPANTSAYTVPPQIPHYVKASL